MDTTRAIALSGENTFVDSIIGNAESYVPSKAIVKFELPACPETPGVIRKRVSTFLSSLPFSQDDLEDVAIAVGEAGTNAFKYGCAMETCCIRVRLERRRHGVRIMIADEGHGFDPSNAFFAADEAYSEHGRGIMCMRALMDSVEFKTGRNGMCVILSKNYTANKKPIRSADSRNRKKTV